MKKHAYKHFTTNEIKPNGWLKRQLEIEAEGLVGNLDKVWPDIRDSKWIGGTKEGWERVPYWLDGFIPLAYLLDNDDMKARAKKYVDAILERQQPDGWICPCSNDERASYDLWAVFIICKALVVYAECSGDERIYPAVSAALKNLKQHICIFSINRWAAARWYECFISLGWLYDIKPEKWIEELARELAIQGFNYQMIIDNFTSTEYDRTWQYTTHVVNLAMAIKCYAVAEQFVNVDGNGFADKFLSTIRKYHSTAYGLFTGDECIAGDSPVQGTELCAIVEAMYSFETLFEITGNTDWLDKLEVLAFNALPATVSNDMWSHQYDQQVNQISCTPTSDDKPAKFTTNTRDAHIFGLEPNFGCCTSNMGQGFPKFALSTFYRDEKGIVSASIAPCTLNATVDGVKVKIVCDTEYPFKNTVKYHIECEKPISFRFGVRIPNCTYAKVNGKTCKPAEYTYFEKEWSNDTVTMDIVTECNLEERPRGLKYLKRGNLIFSLPIKYEKKAVEYERDGVERKFPYCDYYLTPTTEWNYGFAGDNFKVEEHTVTDTPFSDENPALTITAEMAKVDWKTDSEYPEMCALLPESDKKIGEVEKVVLYPYGSTSLRMTEMPIVK